MKSYIIEGGNKVSGIVKISGSKNAALPILAATILNSGTTKLYNIPNISDTKNTLNILEFLGCKIRQNSGKIEVNSRDINTYEIPEKMMCKMRSTVILAGAILGRYKEVTFTYPGGCDIGARPIDLHINALKKMGIDVKEDAGKIKCTTNRLVGADISLDFPSVGATENIMLAAVLADGTTTINNAAMEPEIIDLANFLNKMGAKIEGYGTSIMKIKGVKSLKNTSYNIMPDRIEAGTFLCVAAATGGNVILKNANEKHLSAVISKLEECGCKIIISNNTIQIIAPKRLKQIDIKTTTYPGFPTDLQQIFTAMLLKSSGTSVIVENIFESRYKYISELKKMNAKISIEGRTAIVTGRRKTVGTNMNCTDLRGGAAMVVAALAAKGKSRVNNIEYILRGYEHFEKKLNKIGAKIKIEET